MAINPLAAIRDKLFGGIPQMPRPQNPFAQLLAGVAGPMRGMLDNVPQGQVPFPDNMERTGVPQAPQVRLASLDPGVAATAQEQGIPLDNPGVEALSALKRQEASGQGGATATPQAPQVRAPQPPQAADSAALQPQGRPAGAPNLPLGPDGMPDMAVHRNAIKSIESAGSGGYGAVGPMTKGDRAYGAYQIMGRNIGPWSREALGRSVSIREFMANPSIQDAIFDYKFLQSAKRFGSFQDAASVWFTGRPINTQSASARDVLGTSGKDYVSKYNRAIARQGGAPRNIDPDDGTDTILARIDRIGTPDFDPSDYDINKPPSAQDQDKGGSGAPQVSPQEDALPPEAPVQDDADAFIQQQLQGLQQSRVPQAQRQAERKQRITAEVRGQKDQA